MASPGLDRCQIFGLSLGGSLVTLASAKASASIIRIVFFAMPLAAKVGPYFVWSRIFRSRIFTVSVVV